MRIGARPSRLKLCVAAVVAVLVGLTTVSCSDDDPPADGGAPSASAPSSGALSSMTIEEARRRLPMDGTDVLPISWDLSQVPDGDEVLAARRSLAFIYWMRQSSQSDRVMPLGQFFFTERFYQNNLEPFINVKAPDNPTTGPIWVKILGVAQIGPDRSRVTFCTDIGYWLTASAKNRLRENRANVESFEVENVQTGDGERQWLADQHLDPDLDRRPKYQPQCTKWAQHKP